MKRGMFNSIILVIAVGIIFSGIPIMSAYADDTKSGQETHHFHIKGKITTPDGKGIQGVDVLALEQGLFLNLPQTCMLSGWGTWAEPGNITAADGSYNIRVSAFLKEDSVCQQAFENAILDPSKLVLKKPGYTFKLK
jgi:hypothetical protein